MVSTFGENWEPNKLEFVKQITRCQFSPDRLRKAVESLIDYHPSFPPLAGEFVAVCRKVADSMPRPAPVLITDQKRADPAIVAAASEAIKTAAPTGNERWYWAVRVLERITDGEALARVTEQFALEALKNLGQLARVPQAYRDLKRFEYRQYQPQQVTA
jgi:hypothetical protein